MVNCDILSRRPVTDDEILQETIRQIYHLTAQGELYESYWLARIWESLIYEIEEKL